MSTRNSPWPAGTPSWVDLACTDVEASAAFYRSVLGWEVARLGPEFGEGPFLQFLAGGRVAAGAGPAGRGPTGWHLFVATDDAAATCAAAAAAGARVLLPPRPVGDHGTLAAVLDPAGVPLGLWQADRHPGARVVDEPGALVWCDLRSPDPAASRGFCAEVFGWSSGELADGWGAVTPAGAGRPAGGIGPDRHGRPGWLVHFGVADCDAAAAAARAAGGTVLSPPRDTPLGRVAELADPAGALLAVVSGERSRQPDRS
ncbi:VOC family protein [Kineococcus sp. SYSU DK005]|uniref:VOC family protein n=1 Tax=Kineococcus sp. SYSU DK005 TaxID=3383126 RepID=UPI003D7C67A0